MKRRAPVVLFAGLALAAAFLANLALGASAIPLAKILTALTHFNDADYDHFVVLYQRLPRALIAMFVGAVMACCRASPATRWRHPRCWASPPAPRCSSLPGHPCSQ